VIWEFSDMPIDADMFADLKTLHACLLDENNSLCQILCHLLTSAERAAMLARIKILLQQRTFPAPQVHRRNYPWPPI
jgi:hypothetical protein